MLRASLLTTSAPGGTTVDSATVADRALPAASRPRVHGKFIFVGPERFLVKGVTYGPFRPDAEGCEYHDPASVQRDFALMRAQGINSVRTYTVPPTWLLDLADEHGLKVMIGLPWEQHVAFLDDETMRQRIESRVREAVSGLAGHPAILCYAIGNEIPSPIARWYGRLRLDRFLERLYRICKEQDPEGLVTYANYPSTEYLDLPFLDFLSFNVYLETQEKLEAYLARLQNIAHDRPLLVTELGLDSLHHGCDKQAQVIEWQARTVFAGGCAGAFVFSWTDEWFRGGSEIDGWQFGVTTRLREPKPSLNAIAVAYREVPFAPQIAWPRISVVVCTHNGARTLPECLAAVRRLDYPDVEAIVVDDGSTDRSAEIAARYPVRLIRTDNQGLSSARNTGLQHATGEIIAYLDDDAYPDPYWLKYLAMAFVSSEHVGIGGPNIPPRGDGFRADCVAHAPGGPIHVLLTDTVAEHLPGCNMAFRRQALEAIGGFDPQFRIAGDDVDLCWRLQQRGWTLGFSPAALVWHHRRNSIRAYWRQQLNYGRAEAMLERKWPEKYNAMGNPTWNGRLYGTGLLRSLSWKGSRIYHGMWGSALFQSVYHTAPSPLHALPTTPEWYLIILILASTTVWGLIWPPLLLAAPLLAAAAGITAAQALLAASRAFPAGRYPNWSQRWRLRTVTAWLHLLQPAARLSGRLRTGLTPWRRRGPRGLALPWPRRLHLWCQSWRSLEQQLCQIESDLRRHDAVVVRGGDFDDWDLEIRGGVIGSVRLRMTVEEHGEGRQMFRLRAWPRCARGPAFFTLLLILICDAAAFSQAWATWAVSGTLMMICLVVMFREIGSALAGLDHVTREWKRARGS